MAELAEPMASTERLSTEPTGWGPWRRSSAVDLASPILSVAAAADGLWVGGLGGVARFAAVPAACVRPLTCVAALCVVEGWLVAGGAEGLARHRLGDPADAWEAAQVQGGTAPVAALLALDGDVVLAATVGDGVLRSTDRGRTFVPASFGLADAEVSALAAVPGGGVLAGTPTGALLSTNLGRAWRGCPGVDAPVAAFTTTGDVLVAGLETGGTLGSVDGGRSWAPLGALPAPVTALATTADGTLLAGTVARGLWSSVDRGASWQPAGGPVGGLGDGEDEGEGLAESAAQGSVHCLVRVADVVYAGTDDGLVAGRDTDRDAAHEAAHDAARETGRHWAPVAVPPTHDLDRLLFWRDRPLLAGSRSGLVHLGVDGRWELVRGTPFPLTAVAVTPEETLVASGPDGLFLLPHTPPGAPAEEPGWIPALPGSAGEVGCLTFGAGGEGWAAPARHGDELLRTSDGGRSWQPLRAPFGTLPAAALTFVDGVLVAATFDRRRGLATVWVSDDGGLAWRQEATAETEWPVVGLASANATAGSLGNAEAPRRAALSLGRMLFVREGDRRWSRLRAFRTGIRAMTTGPAGLLALTDDGLWLLPATATQAAATGADPWIRVDAADERAVNSDVDDGVNPASAYDLAARGDDLLVLLTGGSVWSRNRRRRG